MTGHKCGRAIYGPDFNCAVCNSTVPRVASSLDDLRVGQTITVLSGDVWSFPEEVDASDFRNVDWWNESQQVVILSDPPPEPVTVSREKVDALAESLKNIGYVAEHGGKHAWESATDDLCQTARALVEEVRRADA